jgi:hypothetical protein
MEAGSERLTGYSDRTQKWGSHVRIGDDTPGTRKTMAIGFDDWIGLASPV